MQKINYDNLVGKEVWFTHKKKGICHGFVEKVELDYAKRLGCIVKGHWYNLDRLFESEESLRKALNEYERGSHNLTLDELSRLTTGRIDFRVTYGSKGDHPVIKKYCL